MRKTATSMVAAVALLLTGACTDDSGPSAPPTPTDVVTSSPTSDPAPTTASPTTELSPTTDEVSGPPEMPDEAREYSEAGAEAFVRHYVELLNYSTQAPESGLLEPYGLDSCQSCANLAGLSADMIERGERLAGPLLEIRSIHALTSGTQTGIVTAEVTQTGVERVDQDGNVVSAGGERREATFVFTMNFDAGWSVELIQLPGK